MKKGTLICYQLKGFTQSIKTQFWQKLFGYMNNSNFQRYQYRRKGLLDEIPYISPIKSVIIIKKEDSRKLLAFLKKYKVKIFTREIILKKSDLNKLDIRSKNDKK